MKLVQTQRTIEDVALEAPVEDLEVQKAFNHYLNFHKIMEYLTFRPQVLNGTQIDLLLQKIIQRAKSDSQQYILGLSNYINRLINTSIEAGNDQFVLHTEGVLMNNLLPEIGNFSIRPRIPVRPRITIYGNVGGYFAYRACNVDVTVYGDCEDVGARAKDSSFEVHGNIAEAIYGSESTRLIVHGDVKTRVAEDANRFNAEIHGTVGMFCGHWAREGTLTLHSSYGRYLGESASHCTFKVKKEHYRGDIGLVSRLFRKNKVIFI